MNLDPLKDFITQLLSATPEIAVIACLIALGYALKLVPQLPSKFIPSVLLLVSMVVYPMIADNGKSPYSMRYPIVRQVMTGVVLWFMAWAIHGIVIKKLVEKFKLKTGDTTITEKPPEAPKP